MRKYTDKNAVGGKKRCKLSADGIKIKKLFYVLCPVYACLWILRDETMPPTEFAKMLKVGLASENIETTIDDLPIKKAEAKEG